MNREVLDTEKRLAELDNMLAGMNDIKPEDIVETNSEYVLTREKAIVGDGKSPIDTSGADLHALWGKNGQKAETVTVVDQKSGEERTAVWNPDMDGGAGAYEYVEDGKNSRGKRTAKVWLQNGGQYTIEVKGKEVETQRSMTA